MWRESGVNLDEAAREIKKLNRTRMREDTIRTLLDSPERGADGYRPEGDYKHQQVTLGPYAEEVAAADLGRDGKLYLQPPDNNNDRDLYVIDQGKIQPKGLQVKLGDPNEHIFYSLLKRIERGHRDDLVLDRSLTDGGRLGSAFTRYKRDKLQAALEGADISVIGVPGLAARAETRRRIQQGDSPLVNRVKLMGQNLWYRLQGLDRAP